MSYGSGFKLDFVIQVWMLLLAKRGRASVFCLELCSIKHIVAFAYVMPQST